MSVPWSVPAMDKPSSVFASVSPAPAPEFKEKAAADLRTLSSSAYRPRELRVKGTAELSVPADRASVRVWLSSSKESVNDATNSVSRRLDYILQCVRQHGVKDEDTMIHKFLHREGDQYLMNAEVNVTFSDSTKMVQACSVLLEKLDKSVVIGSPRYYHSPECLSQLRRRVCASAVENAKLKANDISELLGQTLGSPHLVVEDEVREIQSDLNNESEQRTFTNLPQIPFITAFSHVSVTFGLRDGFRKKVLFH
uniref:Interleukin-1 receptor-associated kinase 1 binding protein 1 n=1 Tax=Neogobius melanostomus TaxID=47308 RepID=A0A8C6SI90_9GOBI